MTTLKSSLGEVQQDLGETVILMIGTGEGKGSMVGVRMGELALEITCTGRCTAGKSPTHKAFRLLSDNAAFLPTGPSGDCT